MVPLAELVTPVHIARQQPIYHKNLERVVFVTGEMAGRAPGEAVLDMRSSCEKDSCPKAPGPNGPARASGRSPCGCSGTWASPLPRPLTGIYILLIVQTGSFFMPLLIMMAIPLTLYRRHARLLAAEPDHR
jgi:multidrug efflux pump subunit AcrB